MNRNYRQVPTRFGPDTRFEVRPNPPAPFRVTQETALDQLKNRLLARRLADETEPGRNGYLRRAANEAVALAWITPYPLLVFPGLFDEKAEAALQQAARQAHIRQRSEMLLAV
jgi:hypothetical protein